jgi:hypothetical protein
VDRLTTGRRYARAGSIHVTELINQRSVSSGMPAPLASPAALRTRHAAKVPIRTELEPSAHRLPSRGAQLAKLTSLGAATLVLCGAVAAASMISHDRASEKTSAARPTIRVTGDQALLPDQLDRTVPSAGNHRAPAPREPAAAPAPATEAEPTTEPTSTAEPQPVPMAAPAADDAFPDTPLVAVPKSDLELVRQFYDLLPSDPDSAFALLAPDLLDTTLDGFLESWSTVREIEVLELHQLQEGVVAVVRMVLEDGSQLRVEQLLTVADSPHQIVGAQLLSAQRN